jgi:hypothetical protein
LVKIFSSVHFISEALKTQSVFFLKARDYTHMNKR